MSKAKWIHTFQMEDHGKMIRFWFALVVHRSKTNCPDFFFVRSVNFNFLKFQVIIDRLLSTKLDHFKNIFLPNST